MEQLDQFIERELKLKLMYHHARPVKAVSFGLVEQVDPMILARSEEERELAEPFSNAYRALERVLGFYPLFMAVGPRREDIRMTGIFNQSVPKWSKGVLFSYSDLPVSYNSLPAEAVFTDYGVWDEIWASLWLGKRKEISERERVALLRPDWKISDWMKRLAEEPESVQLVLRRLNLAKADLVSAPNEVVRDVLIAKGFRNVAIWRG